MYRTGREGVDLVWSVRRVVRKGRVVVMFGWDGGWGWSEWDR